MLGMVLVSEQLFYKWSIAGVWLTRWRLGLETTQHPRHLAVAGQGVLGHLGVVRRGAKGSRRRLYLGGVVPDGKEAAVLPSVTLPSLEPRAYLSPVCHHQATRSRAECIAPRPRNNDQ